jgi:hypothetical protein
VPQIMVAWNGGSVATPMGVKRAEMWSTNAGSPATLGCMQREGFRRRLSGVQWAGLGLLVVALLQSRYRRQSAALSMQTHRARSNLRMRLDPPGAMTGFLAQTLLNARRRG